MEKEILETIKFLPEDKRLLGIVIIGVISIFRVFFKRKKKNSNNLKNVEIGKNSDISIGDNKSSHQEFDKLNSDNLKNSKIGERTKIKIGDDNVK